MGEKAKGSDLAGGLPVFYTVAFVGKRSLGADAATQGSGVEVLAVELQRLLSELDRACAVHQLTPLGLSSLAMGADLAFARALKTKNFLHRIFLSEARNHFFSTKDFPYGSVEPEALLEEPRIIEKRVASRAASRSERFQATASELLEPADLLIAVATAHECTTLIGLRSAIGRPGGTVETVRQAMKEGLPVLLLEWSEDRVAGIRLASPGETFVEAGEDWTNHLKLAQPELPHLPGGGHLQPVRFDHDVYDHATQLATLADLVKPARDKNRARRFAVAILSLHVAATFAGLLGLMKYQLLEVVPAGLAGLVVLLADPGAKALLLGAALVLVACEWRHWVRAHHDWLEARHLREFLASARALAGLPRKDKSTTEGESTRYQPFPGSLRHLRELNFTEGLSVWAASLQVLHLRERRLATEQARPFAKGYAEHRLQDQISYYREESQKAALWVTVWDWVFRGSLLLALVGAVTGIFWHPDPVGLGYLIGVKLLPVLLPVLGAATIAWLGFADLERRSRQYAHVADRLEQVRTELPKSMDPGRVQRQVHRAETAMLQEVSEFRTGNLTARV